MGPILYLGDTNLASAAAYLAGLMHLWNWPFDYLPSDRELAAEDLGNGHSLFIISDYPASRLSRPLQERIVASVVDGAGLLMIGGWESFQGSGGNWASSAIAAALPVTMQSGDDRVNADGPLVVGARVEHEITSGLPFRERAPSIGGYNRLAPKEDSLVVLDAQAFRVRATGGGFEFLEDGAPAPLLIVGEHGAGRTAAFASDVAPHWVGPLIDWGPGRVSAQAPGAEAIEVGDCYAQFFRQLLAWVAGHEAARQEAARYES
jgi:uncharacterized membrane protein